MSNYDISSTPQDKSFAKEFTNLSQDKRNRINFEVDFVNEIQINSLNSDIETSSKTLNML